jgi:hypothetical protein
MQKLTDFDIFDILLTPYRTHYLRGNLPKSERRPSYGIHIQQEVANIHLY